MDIMIRMKTEICKMCTDHINNEDMNRAAALIAAGELVAFPTETVYGLGGNALDSGASERIYAAKGRPSDNPLIVHIAQPAQLQEAARSVPEQAKRLADAFWPGPLTMVLYRNEQVPLTTTGGLDTVAVRMPSHPVALELIRRSGCMIAAPSANTSGRPSPTKALHVAEDLSGRIPMILDGGTVGIGIESTIVDLTEQTPMILRPGYITAEEIAEVLQEQVVFDPAILSADGAGRPKAPGMRYRHYAPKAQMLIVSGKPEAVTAQINRRTAEQRQKGLRVAVIATEESRKAYDADVIFTIGSRTDEDGIARHLYEILRECDEAGADVIYSESFATPRIGQAIMNRMLKAAGHQMIEV